jgi:Asp/Glu/hydantoin racemase
MDFSAGRIKERGASDSILSRLIETYRDLVDRKLISNLSEKLISKARSAFEIHFLGICAALADCLARSTNPQFAID